MIKLIFKNQATYPFTSFPSARLTLLVCSLLAGSPQALGFSWGRTPEPSPTPQPTAAPTPTPTPRPTATPTPTPRPTATPVPTAPPLPSPTAAPTSTPAPTPIATPPPGQGGIYRDKIMEIASTSSCAQVSWTSRGRAPAAYIRGMALSFARSYCRQKDSTFKSTPAVLMSRASTGDASKDVLAHYQAIFSGVGMSNQTASPETLKNLYTLGVGLGMRESSGKYCVGYDTSASSTSSIEAESGLFQASYNSMNATPELRQLYDEYQANPQRCHLDIFKEGVSCSPQSIIGTGPGADYQRFNKACPAFAAEYTMTLIRVLVRHFGPLIRHEAQVDTRCKTMFNDVLSYVDGNLAESCADLR